MRLRLVALPGPGLVFGSALPALAQPRPALGGGWVRSGCAVEQAQRVVPAASRFKSRR